MDTVSKALEGGYAPVLAIQILIVTGLVATLLWLAFRRIKNAHSPLVTAQPIVTPPHAEASTPTVAEIAHVQKTETISAPIANESHPPEVSHAPSQPHIEEVHAAPVPTPPPAVTAANIPENPAPAASASTHELEEKIKYLESRLLEYEIVREEISGLSSLKSENERLKNELATLKGGHNEAPPAQVA